MNSTLPDKTRPAILIILIAGIGDMVLASPALRAIRRGYPGADIHLLTSTEALPLARHYKAVDQVKAFPIRELRQSKRYLIDILRLIYSLRRIEYDIITNLYFVGSFSGAMKMGLLYSCLSGKRKVGHENYGFGLFITEKAPKNIFKKRHVTDSMMDIAALAGGIPDAECLDVGWDAKSEQKWEYLFSGAGIPSNKIKIGLNPGGDRNNRRWSPDNYAVIADRLMANYNADVFVLGGSGEEIIAHNIESKMNNKIVNLAGKLSIDDLCYIISRFDLLITNDSGPMHIAAATKTPIAAIFGPENPKIFGPYTTPDLYRIVYKPMHCRPCDKKNCKSPLCLDQITPDDVLAACNELLQSKS